MKTKWAATRYTRKSKVVLQRTKFLGAGLLISMLILIVSCDKGDDEIPIPKKVYPETPGEYIPVEPLADSSALEIPGFPKIIKKYHNDDLYDWEQYFYRPDGNLLKINKIYPQSGPEIFVETYQYDADGKLIGWNGPGGYLYYWDMGQIVKAATANDDGWYGRSEIFYEYNTEGQIIQKTEDYIDAYFSIKGIYSYFGDGNLKTIEFYWKDENEGFKLNSVTSFEDYNESSNLFLEVVIIPGQIVQHQFPASRNVEDYIDLNYYSESYDYNYDSEGRVIEKTFDGERVVYEYY